MYPRGLIVDECDGVVEDAIRVSFRRQDWTRQSVRQRDGRSRHNGLHTGRNDRLADSFGCRVRDDNARTADRLREGIASSGERVPVNRVMSATGQ